MTQATKEKLNNEIRNLKKEIDFMRSAVISIIGKDKEGAYNPKLIKEIFDAAKEKPKHSFENAESFIAKLNKK